MIFDPENGPTSWTALINAHLFQYPSMTIQDVYKLVYQGVMGPEHNIPSGEIFSQRLEAELAGLLPDSSAPLLEPVRPSGWLLRIHLRPWLALGQDLPSLAEACLETARLVHASPGGLRSVWTAFLDELKGGRFPALSMRDAMRFNEILIENSFPPVHHSEVYTARYHPAYRLVAAETFPKTAA